MVNYRSPKIRTRAWTQEPNRRSSFQPLETSREARKHALKGERRENIEF